MLNKKYLKKQAKQIKKEQDQKTKKQIIKADQVIDKLDVKRHKLMRKLFGEKITLWLLEGNIGRGILWLIQDWVIVMLGIAITMWLMTVVLPNMGNMIGHAAGLTTEAALIDQENLMFNPMLFFDLMCLVSVWLLLRLVWQWLNKWFGHWRYLNAKHHGMTVYRGVEIKENVERMQNDEENRDC